MPAGSRIQAVRFLRCANGANIELFEFYSPDQREEFPRPSDVGIQHLAVYVDDLDAAAGELRRVLRPGGPVLVRQAFPGRMGGINLYRRFFPAAGARLAGGLPSVERVTAAFAGAGFERVALRPVDQLSAPSLAAYRDKVRLRADTGLRLLPDDQFAAGLAALDRAVEAEAVPAPVVDRLDLLVLRR